ncbi:glycosyltransferase [Salimicrobium humidisoli]|nr:glycosyltransferase [Salimicrobium humidisoli]
MSEKYFNRFKGYFKFVTVTGICEEENENNKNKMVEKVNTNSAFVKFHLIESKGTVLGKIIAIRNIKKEYKQLIKHHDRVATKAPSLIIRFVSKIACKHQVPYLIEMVGCPWDALWNHGLKGKIIAPFVRHTVKKSLETAPYVVYVTNYFLQKRYPTNGIHTNCSNVSLTNFSDSALDMRLRKQNSSDLNKKTIIGTTGAINVKYKGQQYVIEALGALKKEGFVNFEYQIVGGGDKSYLSSIAEHNGVKNQVKFLGSIPHAQIHDWLDKLDVYAQPSVTEGLPRSLIEAMSRGLPAIGSNVGGIPELLDEECIFNKKSINAIKKLLIDMRGNKLQYYAKRNYNEAKKYDKLLIEERRNHILEKFSSKKQIGDKRE